MGPCTVAEVRDSLGDGSAYTTILTLMRLLEEKGHVAAVRRGACTSVFDPLDRKRRHGELECDRPRHRPVLSRLA